MSQCHLAVYLLTAMNVIVLCFWHLDHWRPR